MRGQVNKGPVSFTPQGTRSYAVDDACASCMQVGRAGDVGALADAPPTTGATLSLHTLRTYPQAAFKRVKDREKAAAWDYYPA